MKAYVAIRLIFNRWVLLGVGLLALALLSLVGRARPSSISNFHPFESGDGRWIQIAFIVLTPVVTAGRGDILQGQARQRGAADRPPVKAARGETGRPPRPAAEVTQLRQRFEEALALLRQAPLRRREAVALDADPRARLAAVPLRPALVRLHRRPGSRQDHRADQLRAALPPRGPPRPRGGPRRGRHPRTATGGSPTRPCSWTRRGGTPRSRATRKSTPPPGRAFSSSSRSRARAGRSTACWSRSASATCCSSRPAEREAHAEAVRARGCRSSTTRLGVRFPIYVLVTKSDLLAGFSEFFGRPRQGGASAGVGLLAPVRRPGARPRAACRPSSKRLERRLYERLPERLEEERDAGAARAALRLPPAVRPAARPPRATSSRPPSPPRSSRPRALRGVYFTSGTQEGSPIDRVMGALARELRPRAQAPAGAAPERPELLPHAPPARGRVPRGRARRNRPRVGAPPQWLQAGAIARVRPPCSVLATLAWWISYAHNRRYLAEVSGASSSEVKKQVAAVRAGARSDLVLAAADPERRAHLSETTPTNADGAVPLVMALRALPGRQARGGERRRVPADAPGHLPAVAGPAISSSTCGKTSPPARTSCTTRSRRT